MLTATDHLTALVGAIPAVTKPESASKFLGASCRMMQIYDGAKAFLAEQVAGIPLQELPRLRLPDEIDRTRPVPILIAVAKEGETPNCWYAPNTDRFAITQDWAESHERNHASYLERRTPEGNRKVWALTAAKALVVAETIPATEWTGWVCDGEETYAETVGELVDQLTDMGVDAPSYCYATYEQGFDFDLQDAIESYLSDEHHEDAEASNLKALLDFYAEWKKTAQVTTYFPAKQLVIIDPERFAADVEAAKALIAAEAEPSGADPATSAAKG